MENTPAPDTSNFLDWVEIKNFKSIKDLRLDCKRVNIFIGKPNVGKSNILEALGMLGVEYSVGKFMNGSASYEFLSDLFYDRDVANSILINTNKIALSAVLAKPNEIINNDNIKYSYEYYIGNIDSAELIAKSREEEVHKNISSKESLESSRNNYRHFTLTKEGKFFPFSENGQYLTKYKYGYVKKYDYTNITSFEENSVSFLLPPSGVNLFSIINRNTHLWDEFAKIFQDQNLELVLSPVEQSFILQKRIGNRTAQYPYFSVADTFRRFIFYIAAIESNSNSVIVFEEPEVHSFPPYTQDIAYRMIYSETNQFFVSTHSPYLLQTLVENLNDEQVAVFVTYYENYETKVKRLSAEELSFVQEYSTDVFFNLDRFIPTSDAASVS